MIPDHHSRRGELTFAAVLLAVALSASGENALPGFPAAGHPLPLRLAQGTAWGVLIGELGGLGEPPPAQPPVPAIAPTDQKFLTWIARKTLESKAARIAPRPLAYQPPGLAGLACQVAVTLREGGVRRGLGVSSHRPVCEAVGEATAAAWDQPLGKQPFDSEDPARLRIEVEVIGEVAPAPTIPSWSSSQNYGFMQRGVHGLVVRFMEAQAALRPSEFIADNTSFLEAVETFSQRANPGREGVEATFVSWFRTQHWHELEPGGEVAELRRGLVVMPLAAVTEAGLTASIDALAEYIRYRQRPGGEFAAEYDPSTDVYVEETSDVRQAGCAWSLGLLARLSEPRGLPPRSRVRDGAAEGNSAGLNPAARGAAEADGSASRTIDLLAQRVTDLEGIDGAAFLRASEGPSKLGATALLALALTEQSSPADSRSTCDRLLRAMLWLQRPEGRFVTIFPPTLEEVGQDFAPGQALLALSRAYEAERREPIAVAFEKALPFYREHFRKSPGAAFAAWQTQAFARMAVITENRKLADFAFEMADWMSDRQLRSERCEWPELAGGIDARGDGHADVVTATCLEALTEALVLARRLKDDRRADRYATAVREAARFVMQLQFRREEGFYVRSLRDCVGGIRAAPWDNRIRIEQCAHALRALVRAREVLFRAPVPGP